MEQQRKTIKNEINLIQKAVIFDMDGVIFDTEKLYKKGFFAASKFFGLHLDETYRVSIAGMSRLNFVEKISKELNIDGEKFYDIMHNYVKTHKIHLKSKNFTLLIEKLKKANFKTALATSSYMDILTFNFERVGLKTQNLFDAVVCGSDVKQSKPAPDIFQIACKKLCVLPENAYVIEDSINGILSAHAACCHPIMVLDLVKPTQSVKEKSEKIFKNMNQAIKYILTQNL